MTLHGIIVKLRPERTGCKQLPGASPDRGTRA
jgi:hypothetical protein